ncbi:MAG: sugar phosphate isomerase/epimerase [Bryobacterales bacterium]|nr:sugar phosphate isomerase/epimerase [Bryobacterales bacterium]
MIPRRSFFSFGCIPLMSGTQSSPRDRLSFITDEVASTPSGAIRFAAQFGLRFVELRNVPGTKRGYWDLSESEQTAALRELRDHGLSVSFIDSPLLACPMPGTEPVRKPGPQEAARFTNRMADLHRILSLAERASCRRIRCFSFRRIADPLALFPRIAGLIEPMAEIASRQGVQLLLENEASCNVHTGAEIAAMAKVLPPTVAFNWDPGNASSLERAFPDAYRLLPISRIANVQIKGKSLLPPGDGTDWPALFQALADDGYQGHYGLETHTPNRVADSPPALERLLRLLSAA